MPVRVRPQALVWHRKASTTLRCYSNDEMTAHGFRAMAAMLANERGFAPDVIGLQLAHAERNKVREAYNRAQRLPERRKMMQKDAAYTLRLVHLPNWPKKYSGRW